MVLITDHFVLAALGKEYALPLLEVLYIKGWITASEVARELSIHVSTAQSYLVSMEEKKLIKSRFRPGRAKLVEYSLLDRSIQVSVDLEAMVSKKCSVAQEKARELYVKERLSAKVSYKWDEENRKILVINFMEKSKVLGRMGVSSTLQLSDVEGRFLWFLPQSTEDSKNVLQIAKEAGLENPEDIIQIVELLEFLAAEKIVVLEKGRKNNERKKKR